MRRAFRGFSVSILMGLTLGPVAFGTTQQTADTDADIAAIERLAQQVKEAYIARDWERFSDFFTQDAIWMPPNTLPLVGKEAWASWVEPWWDQFAVEQMDVSNEEIVVVGDWAFERHNETQVTRSKGGDETSRAYYKGVWILRRQVDGSWKIARYIWNQNPAPDAEE